MFPADDFSGVAIAGAAGPAVEMVKLFQIQLEHYEKVQGEVLSLEGKANQLGQLVRGNLPAAMQGFAVVPLFAGLRPAPRARPRVLLRRHRRPLRGARLPGARARAACTPATGSRPGWREGMSLDDTVALAIRALFAAADEDVATGGPDLVRGIFPLVAAIDADGFRALDDADVEQRSRALLDGPERGGDAVMNMPFYVSPEQVMKDRADYARKGIARGRSLVALECAAGVLIVADNASRTLSKISEIYDRIAFAAVGKYNEFQMLRVAGVRHADLKGYSYSREDVVGQGARQRVRADARPGLHARDEAVRGRAARRRGRPLRRRPRRDVPPASTTASSWTSSSYAVLGGQAEQITEALESQYADGMELGDALKLGAQRARRRRRRRSAPISSRSRCSTGPGPAARSAASRTPS